MHTLHTFADTLQTDLLAVKRAFEEAEFSLRHPFQTDALGNLRNGIKVQRREAERLWLLGRELEVQARDRYRLSLEPIHPDSRQPGLLCRSGELEAAIDMKFTAYWQLSDYLRALEKLLLGRCLVSPASRIGFLVLIHQTPRTWRGLDRTKVDYAQLLRTLTHHAARLSAVDDAIRLHVIDIDVQAADAPRRRNYRDLQAKFGDDAGNTWTGRGRVPRWLREKQDEGVDLESLRIVEY